jgi:hypothetical protein
VYERARAVSPKPRARAHPPRTLITIDQTRLHDDEKKLNTSAEGAQRVRCGAEFCAPVPVNAAAAATVAVSVLLLGNTSNNRTKRIRVAPAIGWPSKLGVGGALGEALRDA